MKVIRVLLAAGAPAVLLMGCQATSAPNPAASTPLSPTTPAYTGYAAKPVAEIVGGAVGTLVSSSVHYTGAISSDGRTITFEVWHRDASEGRAVVVYDGHTFEVIRNGGDEYVKADEWFWTTLGPETTHGPAAAKLADRWVKDNLYSARLQGATRFLDLTEVMYESLVNKPNATKGEQGIVNGVPTVALVDPQGGKVYVATDGVPYVIRLEQGDGTSHIDFSDHNKPVQIDSPPAGQVVDLKSVTG